MVGVVAASSASRRRSDIPPSTLASAAIHPEDGHVGWFGGARVRHTVPSVGHLAVPDRPRARPRRRRADDQVAQAGRRGPHFHPARPAPGARWHQLQGPHSPSRPGVGRDQRHQGERRGLVRVQGRLHSAHWRLKSERHLGLPGCHGWAQHTAILSTYRHGGKPTPVVAVSYSSLGIRAYCFYFRVD